MLTHTSNPLAGPHTNGHTGKPTRECSSSEPDPSPSPMWPHPISHLPTYCADPPRFHLHTAAPAACSIWLVHPVAHHPSLHQPCRFPCTRMCIYYGPVPPPLTPPYNHPTCLSGIPVLVPRGAKRIAGMAGWALPCCPLVAAACISAAALSSNAHAKPC